ncbi:MAG: XdhC family protein [Acidobacteriota bacterium]
MHNTMSFWKSLVTHLRAGRQVFLALVVKNTRHSPGTAGARMLLSETGERVGTIGGGIMEYKLLARAAEILQRGDFAPELRTLHHQRAPSGERSGMICAGSQTNLYRLCRPADDLATVERLIEMLAAGGAGTLSIDPAGMRVAEGAPVLSRPPRVVERDGESWSYEEQLLNRRRLAILGGGHCALALARVMGPLGYDVVVYETRENVFEAELEQVARSVRIVADFRQAGALIDYPEMTQVVVMTTDFPSDVRALSGVVARPFPFLGVMGAPAKISEIEQRLRAEGFSEAQLERLHAPVGLPIPSHTPEEIAISVAAQILQLRGEIS